MVFVIILSNYTTDFTYLKLDVLGIFLYFDTLCIFPPGLQKEVLKQIEVKSLIYRSSNYKRLSLQYCKSYRQVFRHTGIDNSNTVLPAYQLLSSQIHVTTHVNWHSKRHNKANERGKGEN